MSDQSAHNGKAEQIPVYIKDDKQGWIPAKLKQRNSDKSVTVLITTNRDGWVETETRTVNLKDYKPTHNLPLQCVDDDGVLMTVDDMRELPYLHEASVLHNLKERYEQNDGIYTRAHDRVLIAVNPYKWIDGLYAEQLRISYAKHYVWNNNSKSNKPGDMLMLQPHLYEVSSLAMKGIQTGGGDQTIIVSGESGSGKTTASKIIMSHLATFHKLKKAYIVQMPKEKQQKKKRNKGKWTQKNKTESSNSFMTAFIAYFQSLSLWRRNIEQSSATKSKDEKKENETADIEAPESFDIEAPEITELKDDEPEEMRQTNLIVQRVLDSTPLLQAFGNAKTQFNDNSSRFSRHAKLQFHVQNNGKLKSQSCNIAGSVCETFLLEKSRVVGHDESIMERTFHIFYQLMQAPDEDKEKIWSGLIGKDASSFRYIGDHADVDMYTNEAAWKKTIAALQTINVQGKALETMLRALCVVIQLGNVSFKIDPNNPEGSVVKDPIEINALSQLLNVSSREIVYCLTHKTVSAVHDTYEVPLNEQAAKATCDAFAKEIYSVLFDWLVQRTNEATCATKNYMFASDDTHYRHIASLDLFGFECHEKNTFEQLMINHANERLQKSFTETFIDAARREFNREGISVEDIKCENNDVVLKLLEGKIGLLALLNEECIRPQGSDAGFVNKIYASHSSRHRASALIKKRNYDLSPTQTLFGISHFASVVDYDAKGFVEKNRDNLANDVLEVAGKSSNDIVSSISQLHERSTTRKKSLVGTSLWSKFGKQIKELFQQLEKTRTTYVRCIIPNTKKKPMTFDSICAINQLRAMGLLTAIEMSHAYPNKQKYADLLQRFWPLISKKKSLKHLREKYRFGKLQGKDFEMKQDCLCLLSKLLQSSDTPVGSEEWKCPFAVGNSHTYFRPGGLEQLEVELSKELDRCATSIQAVVRGYRTRKRLDVLRGEGGHFFTAARFTKIQQGLMPILMLPLSLCRFLFGVFRPQPPMLTQ